METIEKIKLIYKFSWSQALSDLNGKTSIIALAGAYVTFIGGLGFLYGGYLKDPTLVTQAVVMTGIGTSLLMGRKLVNGKPGESLFDEINKKSTEPNQP